MFINYILDVFICIQPNTFQKSFYFLLSAHGQVIIIFKLIRQIQAQVWMNELTKNTHSLWESIAVYTAVFQVIK
jgi:heme/copper-type cytochrome/quinol oxidase subunit 3